MKLLVLSDSHGDLYSMEKIVAREAPDMIIHLGDYVRDGKKLGAVCPGKELLQVSGNCDAFDRRFNEPLSRVFTIDGLSVFACHGHIQLAQGEEALVLAAKESNSQVCLFGHTHMPLLRQRDGVTLLNPGSCGASVRHEYAVIETKEISFSLRSL